MNNQRGHLQAWESGDDIPLSEVVTDGANGGRHLLERVSREPEGQSRRALSGPEIRPAGSLCHPLRDSMDASK